MLRDTDEKCRQCGESRPEAMTQRGPCYECMLIQSGRKNTEDHHPFGRDNEMVAAIVIDEVPGNWHRALDTRRAQRSDILKRPGDNPLHRIAAVVLTLGEAADAFADFSRRKEWPDWVAELCDCFAEAAGVTADWLLILAGKLDEHLGPNWAEDLDMPPWHL
jgi:hypothetical protein